MGTKISQLTETGSAPTGAMVPIEYDDANYRVNAGDFNNKGSGKYVSSWQLASDTDTFTVTHNLGTTDVIVRVYVNTSASDTNAQSIEGLNEFSQGHGSAFGYSATNFTSSSCTVQLGYGYWDITTAGTLNGTNFSSGGTAHYVKFVVLSAGSGSTVAKYVAAWATSHGGTTVDDGAGLTITHNLGTADVIVKCYVNTSASDSSSNGVSTLGDEYNVGMQIRARAANTVDVQLGSAGYNRYGAGILSFAGKYLKVVVIG